MDEDEIHEWEKKHPQPYNRDKYHGLYADIHGTELEPHTKEIHQLAKNGFSRTGHHGPMGAMGVPETELPRWKDIQILTAQLATMPQLESVAVTSDLVIGPKAKRPLVLNIPLMVSDMSYGALSEESKIALARGAELAETGIMSGEGGMLPEEQQENNRYFYELASAKFGFSLEKLKDVQAFHFKAGQGAKQERVVICLLKKLKGKLQRCVD